MPSNNVKINNREDFEWEIPDSKMPAFIKFLNENGDKTNCCIRCGLLQKEIEVGEKCVVYGKYYGNHKYN